MTSLRKTILALFVLWIAGCLAQAPLKPKALPAKPPQEGKAFRNEKKPQAPIQEPALEELAAEEPKRAREVGKDPSGCVWIESEGAVRVGEHDSRHQVHAMAVEQARQAAMQDYLGVEVRSRFMDFQQETLRDQQSLTESILQTTRLGRILNEKVLSERYLDLPGCPACRYHLVLRTCLMPIPEYADRDFHVELRVSPRTSFVEGDEAKLVVTASRDCYLYLYNVGMKGEAALIVPNEILPEVKLKAGQTWEYPDEQVKKRGVSLVAQLPPRAEVSQETVRVIATKTPLPEKLRGLASEGFLKILSHMNVSRIDWAEDAQAFTISRR